VISVQPFDGKRLIVCTRNSIGPIGIRLQRQAQNAATGQDCVVDAVFVEMMLGQILRVAAGHSTCGRRGVTAQHIDRRAKGPAGNAHAAILHPVTPVGRHIWHQIRAMQPIVNISID
jgi:hypothetical protein